MAIGTVSGTTITWAASVKYNGSTNARPTDICYDSTNEKVVIVWREDNGNLYSIVGTVSGTSVTFGSKVQADANSNYWPSCAFDSTTGKVVMQFIEGSQLIMVLQEWVLLVELVYHGDQNPFGQILQLLRLNWQFRVVICVAVSDNHINTGQISGTSINWGTMQAVPFTDGNTNTDETNVAVDPNTGTFMVGYRE